MDPTLVPYIRKLLARRPCEECFKRHSAHQPCRKSKGKHPAKPTKARK